MGHCTFESHTLNQHQSAQSPSPKIKLFQRELVLHVPYGRVLGVFCGNVGRKSSQRNRACFNNGSPFEPHQNHICVFNHRYVAKLALQGGSVCLYFMKSLLFCDLNQSTPTRLQKVRSFNDNFFAFLAQCHVETLCNYYEQIPSSRVTIFCQSQRHLSGHCTHYHTGFSFQIHIKVTNPCVYRFWISYGFEWRHLSTRFNHWVDIWTRSETAWCLVLPIKSELVHWLPLCEQYQIITSSLLKSKLLVVPSTCTQRGQEATSRFSFCVCVCLCVWFCLYTLWIRKLLKYTLLMTTHSA